MLFVFGALLAVFLMVAGDWLIKAPPRTVRRGIGFVFLLAIMVAGLVLVVTGRSGLALAGLFILAPWVMPMVRRLLPGRRDDPSGTGDRQHKGASSPTMDRAEALRILDLPGDAGRDAVQEAYLRLISRLHPDRGGSTYLAARLNEARRILMGR